MVCSHNPDVTEVAREIPTLSSASEALIMQWVASRKCRVISGDIKTAFLSGDEDIRIIIISPPYDVRQNVQPCETVLPLTKAGYGLMIASKKWWDTLKKSFIKHGLTSWALDPFAFVLRKSRKIDGVLGVHVDDVIGGGNETFDRIMTAVRKEFDFGAWDVGNFRIKGRQISQIPNGDIVLTWNSTCMSLNELKCPRPTKPSLSVSGTQRSIFNSEEVMGVWAGLWIIAVHSYHFSKRSCVKTKRHRQVKIC